MTTTWARHANAQQSIAVVTIALATARTGPRGALPDPAPSATVEDGYRPDGARGYPSVRATPIGQTAPVPPTPQ
ncbi:hypothetical protein Nans01_35960 [Nocardiopsis ansamitocini]|uniref:Uncharacterized protein n=1 Tax=Nocardiopsis ansamitocini TaxID=1670832 RepID=A0A9W6P8R2_9ACTN|nr:hypothetical protein Nans01_35960 [Nocardiopsis ansamitocini]